LAAEWARPASISGFVNLRTSETAREHAILLADIPWAGKVESLAQL
jgi:hypothetical protein